MEGDELDELLLSVLGDASLRRRALETWAGGLNTEFANRVVFVWIRALREECCQDCRLEEFFSFVLSFTVDVPTMFASSVQCFLTGCGDVERYLGDRALQRRFAMWLRDTYLYCMGTSDPQSQESAAELGASAALEMREAGVPIDAVMRSALRRSHRIALRQALDVDVIAGLRWALTHRQTPS